jgi:hypothetical protein
MFGIKFSNNRAKKKEIAALFMKSKVFDFKDIEKYLSLLRYREVAWGSLFFFLGTTFLMFIIGDFYAGDTVTRLFFLYSGYLFFILGMIILSYSIEHNEFRSGKYRYTKLFLGVFIAELFVMSIFPALTVVLGIFIIPIVFFMLVRLTNVTIMRSKGLKSLAFPTYSLFLGQMLLLLGFIFTIDLINNYLGLYSRFFGDLLELIGIIFCGLSFYFLPSFEEYEWIEKIRQLYIIHPSGISLYHHNFHHSDRLIESDLTTGAIIAIKNIIEEMSLKGKKLESIKRSNFTVLLEYGQYVISALIAENDSVILREKNRMFIQAFEKRFEKQLAKWFGNTDVFKDTSMLIKQIFGP